MLFRKSFRIDFFLLFLISLFFSCDSEPLEKNMPKDEDIVSEEKMTEIIIDLNLIDGAIKANRHNIDSIKTNAFFESVLEKHNLTEELLDKNLKYYTQRPEDMELIYEKAIAQMTEAQAKLNENPILEKVD
jgi:hypothetical protein